ncbi:hypothetical protein [Asticcacaulis sp. AC402]|uniref:hypothetical protein n=1 Tax=Asticcacaulis sp. AC402 TaxID=1282361 RepID=UPI0003C3FBE2|nr:hypothetical protein [Asticcacaulis sp. AC402]ESQ76184.1 hypothetical protein ABAC402_06955 [Asticcacaulis sp. AC402]
MAHTKTQDTAKAYSKPARTEDAVDTYVWKQGRHAPAPGSHHPSAPQTRWTPGTPWSRSWRIFAAGLIIGIAATKATELLLHPGRKATKVRAEL